MTRDSFLPRRGAAYVAFVIIAGFGVISFSAIDVVARFWGAQWVSLAALTLLSGSATVKLPSVPATISISETFVFTSVLLFGPTAGATIVALDGFIISIWLHKGRKEFYRIAFNMAVPALSIWFAANLYYTFPGVRPLYLAPAGQPINVRDVHLFALLVFTLCHFIVNSWLVAFAVAFETGRRPFDIWRRDFLWLSLNYFGGASVSALLVVYTRDINSWTYLAIIIPLLLILYFTFKIPMARVQDTNLHLQKVNSLYLSTIETLALAIDAKDQVTHGHIRRVQTYTVGLAKSLGLRDDLMLRAIEASALLHDMGKLAIPEHILNKPGKLTVAEFEKMKMHASIGADILSSIEFPYPVVPIVRHHHENWDGTGYPAGLVGTAIPIGARILSVVDCFDALTSDRPYRPALSTDDAIAILVQRRGKMYDPLVVDTFVRIHRELVGSHDHESRHPDAAAALTFQDDAVVTLTGTPARDAGEGLSLFLLYQVLTDFSDRGWSDAADLVVYRLSQVLPVSRCAVFAYDAAADGIVCQSVHGPGLDKLRGVRRRLGEGLSGWVAANKRPVVNSIPALDLAAECSDASEELSSTLSVPLIIGDALVGVLTLYATAEQAFSERHKQVAESIAPHVAGLLRRSRAFSAAGELLLPGYPGAAHLDHYVQQCLSSGEHRTMSLVVLRATWPEGVTADPALLQQVAGFTASRLRGGDLIFVCGPETLVCVLANGDITAASSVKDRLLSFQERPSVDSKTPEWRTAAVILSAPRDGKTLEHLLGAADDLFATAQLPSSPDVKSEPDLFGNITAPLPLRANLRRSVSGSKDLGNRRA
jgi:putative nucleotidyltransferase with HDIG domain